MTENERAAEKQSGTKFNTKNMERNHQKKNLKINSQ